MKLTMLIAAVVVTSTPGAAHSKAALRSVVLSLPKAPCLACPAHAARAIEAHPAHPKAAVNVNKAEVTVTFDPQQVRLRSLIATLAAAGHRARVGSGRGSYAKRVRFPKRADVRWVSRRDRPFDLGRARVAGKITVVDFTASWCIPCRIIDHEMARLLATRRDIALRRVEVVSWSSKVAKRHLDGRKALPLLYIYDGRGRRVATVVGARPSQLRAAITRATAQAPRSPARPRATR